MRAGHGGLLLVEPGAAHVGLSQSLGRQGRQASILVSAAPFLSLVVYPLVTGRIERWGLGVTLVAAALLLALPGLLGWWQAPHRERLEEGWRLASSLPGVPIAVVFVGVVVAAPVAGVALTMALVLIAEVYLTPLRWQVLVGAWTVAGWVAAVWLAGEQEPAALWLHAVGAGLVLVVMLRTVRALLAALDDECVATRAAEQRARLVGDLLAAEDLAPGVVLTNARQALYDLGFDVVLLRRYDGAKRQLELLGDDPEQDQLAPVAVAVDDGVYAQVLTSRQPVELRDHPLEEFLGFDCDTDPERVPAGIRLPLAVLVPIVDDDDEVLGVVSAACFAQDGSTVPVEFVTSLAARFGQLLARARTFRADGELVELLRELDVRTQDVVATVSHELRTPLTVIDGLSRTLEQRWVGLDDRLRAELCTRIVGNADRLEDMIGSLLRSSAFEEGQFQANLAPTELEPLITEVVERMRSVIAGHPIRLEVEPDLWVVADGQLLLHVLENLLSNAGKHTPPGTAIRIWARRNGRLVTVGVSDEGPGIAASELPHVQERFYRGGDPNGRGTSGLGLGLALVQRLLDAHDTALHLKSDGGLTAAFDLAGCDR